MTIMESAIAMNHDYLECNNTLGRINVFAEATYDEYKINLKEVALKVLKENGTEEDYNFLATEAANNFIERTRKAISKIVEAVKKFINNCIDKLVKFVTGENTKKAIDKAEEACEKNPKLRSQKIKYENTDKQVKAAQQGIDGIRKRIAKIKAKGKVTEEDKEYIKNIESKTMKIVAATSTVGVLTLAGAIALFKKNSSKSEIENNIGDTEIGTLGVVDHYCDVDMAETIKNAAIAESNMKKTKTSLIVKGFMSLVKGLKETFGKKAVATDITNDSDLQDHFTTNESTMEELEIFSFINEYATVEELVENYEESKETEELAVESAGVQEGLDLDAYFDNMCDELFTESSEESEDDEHVEESAEEETEEFSSELYLESLEKELFEEDEDMLAESYMETLERELFGEDFTTESADEEEIEEEDNSEEETEEFSFESTAQSLLDEMESLL